MSNTKKTILIMFSCLFSFFMYDIFSERIQNSVLFSSSKIVITKIDIYSKKNVPLKPVYCNRILKTDLYEPLFGSKFKILSCLSYDDKGNAYKIGYSNNIIFSATYEQWQKGYVYIWDSDSTSKFISLYKKFINELKDEKAIEYANIIFANSININ